MCLGAFSGACAQQIRDASHPPRIVHIETPRSGSLSGKLTDLHSAPLAGISLVIRNQATGAESYTTTAKSGAFRFASLEVGEYTLDVSQPGVGRGRLEGIVVAGGIESRVQAAVQFEPATPAMLAVSTPHSISASPTAPLTPLPAFSSAPTSQPFAPAPAANPPQIIAPPSPILAASLASKELRPDSLARMPASTPQPVSTHAPQNEPAQAPVAKVTLPRPAFEPTRIETRRAGPDTESAAIETTLALTAPRRLLLSSHFSALSAVSAAAAGSIKAAMLHNLSHLGPIVAASQKPDPASLAATATLTAAQLQALPVSGRRWQEFLLDTPAANASADASQPAYRAATMQSAELSIDGASTRLAFAVGAGAQIPGDADRDTSQQDSPSEAWAGGRGAVVSEAAIREVTATAGNAEAASMRSSGGLTNVSTLDGSDVFHGQGFLFDRQNSWGARNPFTQWVQNSGTTAAPDFSPEPFTPPDHEMVWGLGMGSRIRREKLFWFAALDSYRRNDPGVASVKNPAEFFNLPEPTSSDVTLLSSQLGESQSQAYNDFLGVPASGYLPAGLEQLVGLLGPASRTATQWVGFARLDWQAAERHRLTLEGTGAGWNSPGGGLTRVSETDGNRSFGSSQASETWLLARWEAYMTPNLLAIAQASAGRDILTARPELPSAFEQSFLNGNSWGQLPQIVVDSRYGFTIGNPSRFGRGSYPDEKLYHAQEMLDWVHSRLLVRSGFELDHNADASSLLRNQTGTYNYSNVASFISDALAFEKFGLADALDSRNPHNCGTTNSSFGSQPCYSYYSQMLGPTFWHLSTNDWASFATAQWQINKAVVFSTGLRWELEQMPPPVAALANPELPRTEKLPSLGSNWGPRVSLAIGSAKSHWPVLRLGYGMYYGRVENATIETALTQTGSLRGDLSFFMRPSDDCQHCAGGAQPFPYVFSGQPASVVKPGAVEFAPNFKNPEVHQAVAAIEQPLPDRVELTAVAMLSLGRRLPIAFDTNINTQISGNADSGMITYGVKDPTGLGPVKTSQTTQVQVPFYASWPGNTGTCPYYTPNQDFVVLGRPCPDYQAITQITSKVNSTYEAAMVKLARYGRRGISFHAHYIYAHATDWNPDGVTLAPENDVLDPNPADFSEEYGTSNQDVRHSAALMAIFEAPWKLRNFAGHIGNGWALSGIGQFRSGLPYSMHVIGSIPEGFDLTVPGLGPSMNGSGGDSRFPGLPRNAFRYPNAWKADLRLAKRFDLGEMRQLEVLVESFNLFNHRNVTQLETAGYSIENTSPIPTLCFLTINTVTNGASCGSTTTLTGTGTPIPAFGQPLNINSTNFYRERQIQLGFRMRF